MFSFQGAAWIPLKKLNEASLSWNFSQFLLVESTGIEPVTSCLQGRRSPSWANPPFSGSIYQLKAQRSGFQLERRSRLAVKYWTFSSIRTAQGELRRSGGPRTRFSAEKPRRLQQSTGLLPRAAFRVHFGVSAFRTQLSRSWLLFKLFFEVVGQNGLEPSTSRLSVVCSSQLSYWPIFVEIKSTTYAFNTRIKCSTVALFLLFPLNPLRWALMGALLVSLLRYTIADSQFC